MSLHKLFAPTDRLEHSSCIYLVTSKSSPQRGIPKPLEGAQPLRVVSSWSSGGTGSFVSGYLPNCEAEKQSVSIFW